ncbi:hypothetical protein HYH02_010940 [Chlamydomonas schloesseri]|uniref:AB hydrolase-1 domain-containing protein n=1 Tax=Chlamydomonas schloesseri TaxID=2026947 RepID=A0A835W5U6_9CHLO|nr:hypothetical protein HYH02_010940 [Chlamydomonas schloesseri]|eukprot:KAG2438239.1 hypothetical protein HYH02_010940 [Chlamydomonas schloesseri]
MLPMQSDRAAASRSGSRRAHGPPGSPMNGPATRFVAARAGAGGSGSGSSSSNTSSSYGSSGRTSGRATTSRADLNASLLSALAEQFQRESLPWIQDLIAPLLQGPPQPLTDTVSPEALGDLDSRFLDVGGLRLHVKSRRGYGGSSSGSGSGSGSGGGGGSTGGSGSGSALAQPAAREAQAAAAALQAGAGTAEAAEAAESLPAALAGVGEDGGADSDGPSGGAAPSAPASAGSDGGHLLPPVLLLMHGLNGSTFSWRLQLDELSTAVSPATGGCDVVAYDRPPYGLSSRPLGGWAEGDAEANPYTLAGGARLAAELLEKVMDEQEAVAAAAAAAAVAAAGGSSGSSSTSGSRSGQSRRRAVLVGHSAGASVAVETALRNPHLVSGLVLIAPAISVDPKGFLARADLGQLLRFAWTRALIAGDATGVNYVRRQVLKRRSEVAQGRLGIYSDESDVPQEVIDGFLLPLRAHDWDRGTLQVYRSLQVAGSPQPLQQLRVPVLIIQGRQDTAVPLAAAEAVAAALRERQAAAAASGHGAAAAAATATAAPPVTELVVLEGCGHVPMDEQPAQVLALTAEFINRHCTATVAAAGVHRRGRAQQPHTSPGDASSPGDDAVRGQLVAARVCEAD